MTRSRSLMTFGLEVFTSLGLLVGAGGVIVAAAKLAVPQPVPVVVVAPAVADALPSYDPGDGVDFDEVRDYAAVNRFDEDNVAPDEEDDPAGRLITGPGDGVEGGWGDENGSSDEDDL